jgi:hypothetical protein
MMGKFPKVLNINRLFLKPNWFISDQLSPFIIHNIIHIHNNVGGGYST